MKTFKTIMCILLLGLLMGCKQIDPINYSIRDRSDKSVASATINSKLAEVTTPKIVRELERELAEYRPQIKIITPKAGKTINRTDIAIELAVENFSVFQDEHLNLGNHINLIVDNEPLQSVYSLDQPLIIKDLAPGTHTVRAFAVRPWGESFKNEGASAQTTFNILTQTNENRPNPELPLLTYNSPTGTYGAEPMLLDYLIERPKELSDDRSLRVKATINGDSFILPDWQPYYLTGFEPGENWVQLELVDLEDKAVENTFNNTVRVFNYDPSQQNALAKLVENQISVADARSIVSQNYIQPLVTSDGIDRERPEKNIDIESEAEIIASSTDNTVEFDEANFDQDKTAENFAASESSDFEAVGISETQSTSDNKENEQTLASQVEFESPANSSLSSSPSDLEQAKTDSINNPKVFSETEAAEVDAAESATSMEFKLAESESKINKIVITQSDAPQTEIAEIIIPEPESIEISGSDVAIAIPERESEATIMPKDSAKSLWWRKILVGMRRSIEAFAKQLPDEV